MLLLTINYIYIFTYILVSKHSKHLISLDKGSNLNSLSILPSTTTSMLTPLRPQMEKERELRGFRSHARHTQT